MRTEIRLPQWGMGMQEGEVLKWLKQEGDPVEAGEDLVEVEAAKVTEVIRAPVSGVLTRILVPEGRAVPVRTLLAVISDQTEEPIAEEGEPSDEAASPVTPAPSPRQASEQPRVQVTPIARRLARELEVDLTAVQGSGPGGRITDEDVRRAAEQAPPEPRSIKMEGMRATIAKRMQTSLQTMAQVTLTTEADVSDLVTLREELKASHEATYTDLVVRAAALALKEHPRVNAHAEGQEIQLLPDIHIGVAVALEEGLIVPVVRHADRKSLEEISQETNRLARRAREGALSPDEATGSTFSVTNLGAYGVDAFTPIINPPEVAILGVGRIVERAARGTEGPVWRQMMTLSLTFDHRVVDGAPAAAFLQAIRERLEDPRSLAG